MATNKKDFTGGLDSLLNPVPASKRELASENVPAKLVRANYVMKADYHRKLKIIAANEGQDIKDALAEALDDFFIKKADLL